MDKVHLSDWSKLKISIYVERGSGCRSWYRVNYELQGEGSDLPRFQHGKTNPDPDLDLSNTDHVEGTTFLPVIIRDVTKTTATDFQIKKRAERYSKQPYYFAED